MAIENALQLEAARTTLALCRFNYDAICQVWNRWTYALPYYSVFAADTLLYTVTLTFDLWPWTFAAYRLWCDETLYQIWTQSSNRPSYCDFIVWPYDLEHCVTCCARLWDSFHQVWPSITYPCLNLSVFMVIRYVTLHVILAFDPLALKVRGTSSVTWTNLYEMWAKSSNPRLNCW